MQRMSREQGCLVVSARKLLETSYYNHRMQVDAGLCREHSSQMLKDFFRQRRKVAKANRKISD